MTGTELADFYDRLYRYTLYMSRKDGNFPYLNDDSTFIQDIGVDTITIVYVSIDCEYDEYKLERVKHTIPMSDFLSSDWEAEAQQLEEEEGRKNEERQRLANEELERQREQARQNAIAQAKQLEKQERNDLQRLLSKYPDMARK